MTLRLLMWRILRAEVPFFRPEKLSDDFTPTIPVVKHALNWLKNDRFNVEAACCIYATAPLVCPSDIIKGYDILRKQKLAFTFSAILFISYTACIHARPAWDCKNA